MFSVVFSDYSVFSVTVYISKGLHHPSFGLPSLSFFVILPFMETMKRIYSLITGDYAQYIAGAFTLIIGFILLSIVNRILRKKIQQAKEGKIALHKNLITLLDLVQKIAVPLAYLGIFSFSIGVASFGNRLHLLAQSAFAIVSTFVVIRAINRFLEMTFSGFFPKNVQGQNREKSLRPLLSIIQGLLWVLGLIFLLGNLGVDVTAALAGLGVGGIAVAIAAQALLGDLFSYFVIYLDKPFEIGDFIVFQDTSGTVEKIGIKSSRVRALSGEILVISNSILTTTLIHNYKQMQKRRIAFSFAIPYETPHQSIEKIPTIVKEAVEGVKVVSGVLFDRSHLNSLGDGALSFETVYYVPSGNYSVYMDVQQEIYLSILKACEEEGITLAYPTQRVFTSSPGQLNVQTIE
ncbi:MAG: mechanosensitive ion channel family protein [Sphaerochaetaceae bacterium]